MGSHFLAAIETLCIVFLGAGGPGCLVRVFVRDFLVFLGYDLFRLCVVVPQVM